MKKVILIVGGNGCVGRPLVRALLKKSEPVQLILFRRRGGNTLPYDWPARSVETVEGDITVSHLGLSAHDFAQLAGRVQIIVHAAADTRLNASYDSLRQTNVGGTEAMVELAAQCPRLERFVHISSTCVAGQSTGLIDEVPFQIRPRFTHGYEQTKFEAEEAVLAAGLPARIVRLATVAGSERDGAIDKPCALQLALYFLYRGYLPMIPGRAESTVDLISTEYAVAAISAVLFEPWGSHLVYQVSAADHAASLSDLLHYVADQFAANHRGWARGACVIPPLVDEQTYRLFEDTVRLSNDLLFQQVLNCTSGFLPGLLFPKHFSTDRTRALLGDANKPVSWRNLVGGIIERGLARNWERDLNHKPESEFYECVS